MPVRRRTVRHARTGTSAICGFGSPGPSAWCSRSCFSRSALSRSVSSPLLTWRSPCAGDRLLTMAEWVLLFNRAFATTIAFVLPGLAVLVGAATVTPVIGAWFGAASVSPSAVGFLFVLLAALSLGMIVTSVRWWIFECARLGPYRLIAPNPTPIDERKRNDCAAAYEDIRFSHYYHYLASANMSVAIPIAVLIWYSARIRPGRVWGRWR